MKRGLRVFVFSLLAVVLVLSIVSAFSFKELFGVKNIKFGDGESSDGGTVGTPYKDTGKTVLDKYRRATIITCNDSDKGVYPGIEGFISYKVKKTNPNLPKDYVLTEKVVWDYCSGNKYGDFVVERYCWTNGTFRTARVNCENGCENGKCKQLATCQQFGYQFGDVGASCGDGRYDLNGCYNETKSCIDNDLNNDPLFTFSNVTGGMSIRRGPTCSGPYGGGGGGGFGMLLDVCINSTTISEASCTAANNAIYTNYTCQYGCSAGKCDSVPAVSSGFVFENDGDESIKVKAHLKTSYEYINLLYGNSYSLPLYFSLFGKDPTNKLVVGNTAITFNGDNDSYFVASWADGSTSESYLMKADSFKTENSINYTTISYKFNGAWKEAKTDAQPYDVLSIGSIDLTVERIDKNAKRVDIRINSGGSFNKIYDINGSYFALNSSSLPAQNYNFTVYNKTGVPIKKYQAYWNSDDDASIRCVIGC